MDFTAEEEKLFKLLLPQNWHRHCKIITGYVPSFCKEKKERVVVRCYDLFLRYSKGPVQGYFWDMYGDDFLDYQIALMGLQRAPYPESQRDKLIHVPDGLFKISDMIEQRFGLTPKELRECCINYKKRTNNG